MKWEFSRNKHAQRSVWSSKRSGALHQACMARGLLGVKHGRQQPRLERAWEARELAQFMEGEAWPRQARRGSIAFAFDTRFMLVQALARHTQMCVSRNFSPFIPFFFVSSHFCTVIPTLFDFLLKYRLFVDFSTLSQENYNQIISHVCKKVGRNA